MSIYETKTTPCATTVNTSALNKFGMVDVDFNTIHNSTGTAYEDGGYLDFSSSLITTLSANTSYSFTVTSNTTSLKKLRIYIDYNNDGDFTDTGELIYNEGSETAIYSGSITTATLPVFDAILTMRIIGRSQTITTSCPQDLLYGQVEDYGVVFPSAYKTIPLTKATDSLFSDGMIIEDISFIQDSGDFIKVSNNESPYTWTTSDIASGTKRWDRIWQINIDDAGLNGGNVKLIFDFIGAGFEQMSANNSTLYYLCKRQGESGDFTQDIPATMVSGNQVIFDNINVNDLSDNYYYSLEAGSVLEISDISDMETNFRTPDIA